MVRMKYAVDLLSRPITLSQLSEITGHYDPSHFVHDFKDVYGLTPTEYIRKMSLFYNDPFKLKSYNKSDE
ncbi:helix-turn-helix domain-containing protein [Lacrimispora brassicae]